MANCAPVYASRPPNRLLLLLLVVLLLFCHVCPVTGGVEAARGMVQGAGEEEEPRITWGHPNTNTAYFREDTATNITAIVGHKASLPCHVVNLGKKEVSWIRQRDLHILTVGIYTYTSDDRFQVYHPEKSDKWYLEITSVTFRDAGVYECQVSASPKISLPILLSVEVQQARIEGPAEVFIQKGSTIRLTCRVNTHAENVGTVTWFRDTYPLDYDSPRGGVSVEIEKTPTRTTSKLFITRAMRTDVGNYTCVPQFADAASVLVHVVNGEESAAVHTAGSVSPHSDSSAICGLLALILVLVWR